jgi:hypothetical protein
MFSIHSDWLQCTDMVSFPQDNNILLRSLNNTDHHHIVEFSTFFLLKLLLQLHTNFPWISNFNKNTWILFLIFNKVCWYNCQCLLTSSKHSKVNEFWLGKYRLLPSSHKGQLWTAKQAKIETASNTCLNFRYPTGRGYHKLSLLALTETGSTGREVIFY